MPVLDSFPISGKNLAVDLRQSMTAARRIALRKSIKHPHRKTIAAEIQLACLTCYLERIIVLLDSEEVYNDC